MTSLTTCNALQYAVIPYSSQKFEKLSKRFTLGDPVTELDAGRNLFFIGLGGIAMGGVSLLATNNSTLASAFLIAWGSCVSGMGSAQLYFAAKRIQKLWESNRRVIQMNGSNV